MQLDEKLKEKLLKIKALADWWVWWEKDNAKRMLDKMLEANWITVDDLNDETTHEIVFKSNQLSKIAFMT